MADDGVTNSSKKSLKNMGCGTFIGICIIAFVLLGIGLNQAVGYYFEHCSDEDVFECFFHGFDEPAHTGVAAKGIYTSEGHSAEFTMYIPLEGGGVTGNISETCTAKIKGTYDGKDNGIVSGTISGYCDPFIVKIPAKGTFSGTVQKNTKKVPIFFKGSGGGLSKEDSMTLNY